MNIYGYSYEPETGDNQPTVFKCAVCGEDITVGEDYWTNGEKAVCDNCADGYRREELMTALGFSKVCAEED